MASPEVLIPPSAVSGELAEKDFRPSFRPSKGCFEDKSAHREWNFLKGEGLSSSSVRNLRWALELQHCPMAPDVDAFDHEHSNITSKKSLSGVRVLAGPP